MDSNRATHVPKNNQTKLNKKNGVGGGVGVGGMVAELSEFSDEIDTWIIDEFSKVGLDTAKSILEQDVDDLVKRTDLEEETINEVMRILKEEFEE